MLGLRTIVSTRVAAAFPLVLLALQSGYCAAAGGRSDVRVPLEYDAKSNLYTTVVRIGTPARSYRTLVDTGSAFLLLQRSEVDVDRSATLVSTTRHPFPPSSHGKQDSDSTPQKVDIKGKFTFTNADGSGQSSNVGDMHFFSDTFEFASAGGGSGLRHGDVVVGSTALGDLKGMDGILGLAPPFSKVATPPPPPPSNSDPDKSTAAAKGPMSPELDVSFLHSFLNGGATANSGFYITLNSSNATPGGGELVFPAEDYLPRDIPGYDAGSYFQVDPDTGCTFPRHAFWGIAHRPDLAFVLSGEGTEDALAGEDVMVDAVLLDSGTSGILGPRSEVDKISARLGDRVLSRAHHGAQGDAVVSTQVDCGASPMEMAFVFAGKRFGFPSVRATPISAGGDEQGRDMREFTPGSDGHPALAEFGSDTGLGGDGLELGRWKSYVSASQQVVGQVIQAGQSAVDGLVAGLSSALQLGPSGKMVQKRSHRQRRARQKRQDGGFIDPAADNTASCSLTVVGSEAVEHMFPRPAGATQDLKVWIIGQEFFQQNLVYHNIDHQLITILAKSQ